MFEMSDDLAGGGTTVAGVRGSGEVDGPAVTADARLRTMLDVTIGDPAAGPFSHPGLGWRVAPFAAVAVVAEGTAWLPPGLTSTALWYASTAVLVGVFLSFFLPWDRLPADAAMLPALAYVASVSLLMEAQPGAIAGWGYLALLLVPVIWCALYHRRFDSLVMVAAVMLSLFLVSLNQGNPDFVTGRRVFFWGATTLLLSEAAHKLRRRLGTSLGRQMKLLREAEVLSNAARELNASLDPGSVMTVAARLAAELASPNRRRDRRAHYLVIEGPYVRIAAEFDETGATGGPGYLLEDHRELDELARTGTPFHATLDPEHLGPGLREVIRSTNVTHGAWVPIHAHGSIHGILVVEGRGDPVGDDLLDRLISLGYLVELALTTALEYDLQRQQATTDPLTGLPNRRVFRDWHFRHGRRRRFAVISIDFDSLKEVNDRQGHLAGDKLLVSAARAMQSVTRQGDIIARIGGDEFVLLVSDAEEGAAKTVANRLLDILAGVDVGGVQASASLGLAVGDPDADLDEVLQAADIAMYEAKRRGGRQYLLGQRVAAHVCRENDDDDGDDGDDGEQFEHEPPRQRGGGPADRRLDGPADRREQSLTAPPAGGQPSP